MKIYFQAQEDQEVKVITLCSGDIFEVPLLAKHQIVNESFKDCTIIEIQYGKRVDEYDIERFFYFPETP